MGTQALGGAGAIERETSRLPLEALRATEGAAVTDDPHKTSDYFSHLDILDRRCLRKVTELQAPIPPTH